MRTASLLAAALVSLTTLPAMAQQADAPAQPTTTASTAGTPANPLGNAAGGADIGRSSALARPEELLPVHAQLMGSLDSKSAKLGDAVELRTQEKMKIADGTEIPKGAKIMGHVTSVVAHGKTGGNALLAVEFDHAVLKGGQSVAIRSEIQWVAPPPSMATAEMMRSQSNIGGDVMGDATRVTGATGGGLGTGGAGGVTTVNGHLVLTDSIGAQAGSVTNYGMQAPQTNGLLPAGADKPSGGSAIASTNMPARATGVPGVMLAGDAGGQISGTFSAMKQNVHLDGGTRVVLAVAAIR